MLIKKLFSILLFMVLMSMDLIVGFGDKRKKIIQHGDLMIGVLLPVHEQPSYDDSVKTTKSKCGLIRDQYGIQRVEALLFMLDKINSELNLLPGIKLGIEIRDECWVTSVALEETIDFIKHTIASAKDQEESDENVPIFLDKDQMTEYTFNNTRDKICQKILKDKENENKILAVIGPAGSDLAINVQNLVQLFDIPQVAYSATSTDLSNKKMYKTFLRVVPSDYLQVRAMTDLVVKMNWTYVFAIYTDGSYGQGGMEAFRNRTSYLNICLVMYEKITQYANDDDYENLIKKMNDTESARVIVCFCYGETIRGLLGAINRLGLKGRFIIIGSDGWSDRIDVARGYYEEAIGSLSIKAHSPVVTEFHDYFAHLNPSNNLRNTWFNEYWEYRFNCYIEKESKNIYKTPCKRKCPIEFQEIGNKCYWFSSENLNWQDARKKCESKYHYSDLLDLNNQQDLKDFFNHISNQSEIKKIFSRVHVRIELNAGTEKSNIVNEYNFDAESIIFRTCGKTAKRNAFEQNYEMSDFESSISSEDVITFYNSKINNNQQCISIMISNNLGEFDYCVKFKNCHSKFPFVCKINTDKIVEKISGDYYPDSLHNYQQDPKMSYVINALLAVTHGLARIHKNVCGGLPGLCDGMKKITGNELFTNIRESSFSGITGEKIDFDSNGDPPGRYVILNVQKEFNKFDNSTRYVYKEVGSWNNENRLSLNLSKLVFPNSEQNFVSICSKECDFGYVKQIKQGGLKCCWNCKKCEEYSYILDDHTCQECDLGYWPNKNLTGCDNLSLKYLKWSEPASIFALLVSTIGILINTFVTHIFVRFSDTSVVKSTTKQLSFIILVGIYLCYLTTIPLILKPSLISCYLARILPGLNLSIIYGALLTKTNRIARILSQSKKRFFTKKLRFMSITSQILISLVIISFECCLIITGLFYEPKVIYVNYSKRSEARLECSIERISVIGPLGYNMFLVALCTLYAIQTRNLPENFNEAKFIGFSMYTTCVIWIAFFPLFFGSDFKVITLSLSISFSATIILAFLFIPKVYIIIFEPEKNQRSAFTTTKNLRCHIGSNMQSSSFLDYDMPSSQRKKSNGMFLLAGLAGLRTPSQITESKPKYSINYTRYAFRPKISKFYGYGEKKSIDSMDNGMSIYQISDRSCQTSLEYLPILKDSIKKRKGTRIEKRNSIDEPDKNEKENDAKNFGALGALGNILFLPLIATNKKKEELDKQENFEHDSDDENQNNCFRISTDSFKNKHLEEKYCPDQSVGLTVNIEKKDNLIFVEANEDLNSNNESNLEECDALSNEPTGDDYSDKMNHEDESLEDLRKIFTKNRNLVLQWDYVQSSGYL